MEEGTTPPETAPEPAADLPPYSYRGVWSLAASLCRNRYGHMLGMSLVGFGVILGAGMLGGVVDWIVWDTLLGIGPSTGGPEVTCFQQLGQILLSNPVTYGLALGGAIPILTGGWKISDAFAGLRRYWMSVGLCFVIGLALFAAMVPGISIAVAGVLLGGSRSPTGFSGGTLAALGAGVVVALVGVFAIGTRVWMAPALACDWRFGRARFGEAFALSWRMTRGRMWSLAGLYLSATVLAGVSLLLFVLPFLFFGLPLIVAAAGAAYATLTQGHLTYAERCAACGYPATGVRGDVCPECGLSLRAADPEQRSMHR